MKIQYFFIRHVLFFFFFFCDKKSFFFFMEEEDNNPKLSPEFQEKVVNAIVKGDLEAFKKLGVGNDEINRQLLPQKELKPVPKYNKDQSYIIIKGPTTIMFAILCEQDEIVEYILESTNPDVSIKVKGYNCLHLAAIVKDPRCLKHILQHEWIQQEIDEPVDFPSREGEKTTALHLAVSNRNYDNVKLLTNSFPKPRWSFRKRITNDDDDDDCLEMFPSNVSQKSASGLTPLYIAVSLCDYKMVEILLSVDADPFIECANNKTPIQLALDMQKEKKDKSKQENDEIDLIVTALQNY